MKSVFVDTAPLIYLLEGTPARRDAMHAKLLSWLDAGVSLRSSVLTLAELLVPVKKAGDVALARQYRSALRALFDAPLFPLDEAVAEYSAEIRAIYGFRTPDALQLAAARVMGCDAFFTNDRALRRFRELEIVLANE